MTTQDEQNALTPELVLADLKAGNARFTSSNLGAQDWLTQAKDTASGQYPKAVILGCIDSRVPVETIFDQAIGDVFVARVAGNVVNSDILGSMEFATKAAGAKLVVVLGHTGCGAVMGAIDGAELGNLTGLLAKIKPVVEVAANEGDEIASSNGALLDRVTIENVRQSVRAVTAQSSVMAESVQSGELEVVGAVYDIATGAVTWLDEDS